MPDQELKRKLTAILSADAVGYSRLMGQDEEATVRTIKVYRGVLTTFIRHHNGIVLDSPGDNLLAEFASVVDAVKCAAAVQKEIDTRNNELPEDRKMRFRVGINLGDVIYEEGRIYGDGVNIAARIESLAEPGGVSISRNVYNQVRNKLKFGYQFQGQHSVKNIAEPVNVYRVLMAPEDEGKIIDKKPPKSWRLAIASVAAVLTLFLSGLTIYNYFLNPSPSLDEQITKDLSIAVLPFDNMSNDPEQEYFSNGISENLITDLSKVPDFLVISRNTSFAYKVKSLTIEQIAKELDVRYVLEGSVQKANNLVRINAQLIDSTTGHHLWAERYDGSTTDIFALQDKITQKIAASLEVKLTKDEQEHLTQKETTNIEAYEAFLKGNDLANYLNMDPDGFYESIPWFEKAIQLDPDYSRAYAALAESYVRGTIVGVHRKLKISRRLAILRAFSYLRIAMKNPTNTAYRNIARLYVNQRLHEKGVNYAAKAIALDPNNANSNSVMALALINSGRPDEAVGFSERIRRIDPACLF